MSDHPRLRGLDQEDNMTKRAPVTSPGIRMPILLTSKEVAQMVRVDPSTLSRWRARGTGPRVVWLSKGSPGASTP